MSDYENDTLDAEPEPPAGPVMTQDAFEEIRGAINYLTEQEYARQQEAESEAQFEQQQEIADMLQFDPEAGVHALHEQIRGEYESRLGELESGLDEWRTGIALDHVNEEITDALTEAGVGEDELESAYEIANDYVSEGVAQAAAAHGLTLEQFWQVAAQTPELGEALAVFGKAMLADAADHLKSQKETVHMDEVKLAQSFARRHNLTRRT